MFDCQINRETDLHRATKFSDDELLRIADAQVRNTLHNPVVQSAAQRSYNLMIRRELRKRGLDWSPPTS